MPPKKGKLSPAEKLQREIEQYRRAMTTESGPLISQAVAARMLGVSRQRVFILMNRGRLTKWEFFDVPYLSLPEVIKFRDSRRRSTAA
jgi:hypothetical protein